MSDSDESGVTYMEISSTFEELSDIGSPGVVPSPDYIPGPEEPQSPPPLDYVPEPIYPEYMPQEDEECDPAEHDDEDPEEDTWRLSSDGGETANDEMSPSEDDEDDDEFQSEANDMRRRGSTQPCRLCGCLSFTSCRSGPICGGARVARDWRKVVRLLAISTPPSSPLSPWSSPLSQIPSSPLPLIPSPSLPSYSSGGLSSGSDPAEKQRPHRQSHSLPLPPPIILSHTRPAAPSSGTPPSHLLSTDRREDRPKVTLLPRKRLGIALGPAYEVRESSSAAAARPARGLRADYGFVATMDREIRRDPERDVGYGITDSWDEIVETLQGHQGYVERHTTVFSSAVTDSESYRVSRLVGIDGELQRCWWHIIEDKSSSQGTKVKKKGTNTEPRVNIAPETTNTTSVTNAQLQAMINQGVTAALAARDANTNGVESHNSGTGSRRNKRATRECTYPDFMKCQPINFKDTEGVFELTQWIEKMETVFRISNYSVENQIKFSTCTLLGNALTWWKPHVIRLVMYVAYAMT
ncbi:hypothetical protein Tco_0890913 [Tanacetum coccineum]|uniref:Reverse transcriptase domain-containing protein n=1 Tax=Tanacetum coccineum TaxID=301880 RepID=A0ABQ5C1E2_9ASTR